MTVWTRDNTPNGVWLPPEARGHVALFFRFGPPTRLCPGQLLLIENHAGGITRNLAHWGYDTGAIATRRQTTEEHNHAALCGRQVAHYYQSWPALITDERRILTEYSSIGSRFVERLIELAGDPVYRLLPQPARPIPDSEQEELSPSDLTPEEVEVAQQTAASLGIRQLELFA